MRLTGPVHVAPRDDLIDDVAGVIVAAAMRAVEARGTFHLALSGGTTPEPVYVRLMIDPRWRVMPWDRTHLWLVDERLVPHEDERSNFRMIHETLAAHVPMRWRQVHPMPIADDDGAARYEQELARHVGDGRLDFVLLGMGVDGHTASLFPHAAAVRESQRHVVIDKGPGVTPPPRITMTLPLLNCAREVAVLVTGGAKAAALRRIEAAGVDPVALPITGVQPSDGELTWYLDREAAAAGGAIV
jgi:6-phosphogluconolactonase